MIGLYITMVSTRLVKKLIGMTIFQVSVLLFYISISFINGGAVPIIDAEKQLYVNPLPHVLMLTAIVVGVATLAVGLALIILIKKSEKKSDI
jgi:multicomponent Na+:H+ antiporter subunit C